MRCGERCVYDRRFARRSRVIAPLRTAALLTHTPPLFALICTFSAAPLLVLSLSSRTLLVACWVIFLSLSHAARDFSGFPWDW